MSQLILDLPETMDKQIAARGLSKEQLGRVMTYLLEVYLHVEQSNEFIRVASQHAAPKKARKAGSAKHLGVVMADDFDEPLPDFVEYTS